MLKSDTEKKIKVEKQDHRLVLVSGRTPEAIDYFLDGIIKNNNDVELMALVNEIHTTNIDGHNFRG